MIQETTTVIGLPISLFPENYRLPSNLSTIHQAVSLGMGELWTDKMKDRYIETIKEFVDASNQFQEGMEKYNLSYDEACAITYYTSEAVKILNVNYKDRSPYRVLNRLLAERNSQDLDNWKPFIHFLIKGLNKLPNIETKVYRGINKRVSSDPMNQYKIGSQIVWVAFSSTSKSKDQISNFSDKDQGTWMILSITEGKNISFFSMFPSEEEILLLPNSYFRVEYILTDNMKELINVKPHLDVIELKQIATPSKYKSLTIEEF